MREESEVGNLKLNRARESCNLIDLSACKPEIINKFQAKNSLLKTLNY